MAHYDIKLYATQELQNECLNEHGDQFRAIDRAKEYFEGAFGRLNNHSCTVDTVTTSIPAPFEERDVSNSVWRDVCGWTNYNWLHNFFADYVRCHNLPEGDENILLSYNQNAIGGGSHDPTRPFGVAITGWQISNLSSGYSSHGSSNADDAMSTALHEFAHGAMDGVPNSHQRAGSIQRTQFGVPYWSITPMHDNESEQDGEENHCGSTIHYSGYYEHVWDYCCYKEWS